VIFIKHNLASYKPSSILHTYSVSISYSISWDSTFCWLFLIFTLTLGQWSFTGGSGLRCLRHCSPNYGAVWQSPRLSHSGTQSTPRTKWSPRWMQSSRQLGECPRLSRQLYTGLQGKYSWYTYWQGTCIACVETCDGVDNIQRFRHSMQCCFLFIVNQIVYFQCLLV